MKHYEIFTEKLQGGISKAIDKVDDITGRTKIKNGDDYFNDISRCSEELSTETLSQYRVVVRACQKGEYSGYRKMDEFVAYEDAFATMYNDYYKDKPIAFSRKTKQAAIAKIETATNILNTIKKYADTLKSALNVPSGSAFRITTSNQVIKFSKTSATIYFKELQQDVIPAWNELIKCLNFIADH